MSEERQRVLQMLKAGKITVEEAEVLLEALDEEQEAGSAGLGQQPALASPEPASPAQPSTGPAPGAGAPRAAVPPAGAPTGGGTCGEQPADRPREFHQLIDDIIASVDVDRIMATVHESLKQSKVDVERIKGEVRRAAHRARGESRRVAREYRRHRFGRRGLGSASHGRSRACGD